MQNDTGTAVTAHCYKLLPYVWAGDAPSSILNFFDRRQHAQGTAVNSWLGRCLA